MRTWRLKRGQRQNPCARKPSAARPGERAAPPGEDTLRLGLEDGVVGLVGVLHGDGVRELVQHPLLEGLQPLVVMATAHVFFVLSRTEEHTLGLACGPTSMWCQW